MVNKSLFLLILILGLFSCSPPPKEEKSSLKEEELVNLMLDLHLADIILPTLTGIEQDSFKTVYWKKLSGHYKLSEEDIRREILILESDPKKMKMILGLVKSRTDSLR